MNQTTAGWITFIAALGMMSSLMAVDVARLNSWEQMYSPAFVSIVMVHFGAVITAFIGGKLIPVERDINMRTRESDKLPGSHIDNPDVPIK